MFLPKNGRRVLRGKKHSSLIIHKSTQTLMMLFGYS